MSNYTKTTNFGAKDTLPSGDSQKIIRGTEFDTEFNNIATAVATKLEVDGSNNLAISGTFSSTKLIPTGGTATGNGMYLPAANAVAISTNGTERLRIDSSGVASFASNPILNGGTANGLVYLDGSKVATSGSAVTFDGTNLATTGTASATKLIPTGGTATGNGLYLPAANTLALSTNGTERVRVDSSGNLGIGTASPNTYGKLAVVGDGGTINLIAATNTTTTSVQHRLFNSSGTSVFRVIYYGASYASGSFFNIGANGTVLAQEANAPLSIGTIGVEQPLIFGTNSIERARIDSSGNLGIGTTSPGVKLQVVGTISSQFAADGSNSSGVRLIPATTGEQAVRFITADGNPRAAITGADVGFGPGVMRFYVNNPSAVLTEHMRLDDSGNLGVGTASPAFKLHVVSSGTSVAQFTGQEYGQIRHSDGTRTLYTSVYNNLATLSTESNTPLAFGTNNTERARIDSSGNFGIGTSSPTSKFYVAGASVAAGDVSLVVDNTTATGFTGLSFREGATSRAQIWAGNGSYASYGGAGSLNYNAQSGPHVWYANYTEKARIDSSGNFGLGTSSPLTKLHISGSTTQTITVTCTGGSGVNLDLTATSTEAKIGTPNGVALLFSTSNIERARIKSTGQLRFVPLSADPAGAETGDVYYNSTSNKLKVYNGTAWVDLH